VLGWHPPAGLHVPRRSETVPTMRCYFAATPRVNYSGGAPNRSGRSLACVMAAPTWQAPGNIIFFLLTFRGLLYSLQLKQQIETDPNIRTV